MKILDAQRFHKKAEELKEFLESRMVKQRKAIQVVARAYDYYLSPIRRRNSPLFAGISLGGSGVGKSYLAKLVAEYFFEDPNSLTFIHCPNYFSGHMISELIGSPPGYIGYSDPRETERERQNPPLLNQERIEKYALEYEIRKLRKTSHEVEIIVKEISDLEEKLNRTNNSNIKRQIQDRIRNIKESLKIRAQNSIDLGKNPLISVILFDEIEKCHDKLREFLLEITAEGRAMLSNLETTCFYDSFIFMTSNIGSGVIAKKIRGDGFIGFLDQKTTSESIYKIGMKELEKFFTPEFIGRLRENIVVFESLSREDMGKIRDLQITQFLNRLTKTFPLEIIIDQEVKDFILEKAIDHPESGARIINDKVRKYLEEPIARFISTDQIKVGARVFAKLLDGNIEFSTDDTITENKVNDEIFQNIKSGLK